MFYILLYRLVDREHLPHSRRHRGVQAKRIHRLPEPPVTRTSSQAPTPRLFRASPRTSLRSSWLFRSSSELSWCAISTGGPLPWSTSPRQKNRVSFYRLDYWEYIYLKLLLFGILTTLRVIRRWWSDNRTSSCWRACGVTSTLLQLLRGDSGNVSDRLVEPVI